MICELFGEKVRQCWSGWMLLAPWVVTSFQVQVDPLRVPRYVSMAPRYTSPLSSGGLATYQSYQAWFAFKAGTDVIFVHVVPDRRHRYAVVPTAPKT